MFQIFKDYDGNAPDVNYWLVTTEPEAKRVVEFMNRLRNAEEDGQFAYVEGWEHCARWSYRPKHVTTAYTSFEDWHATVGVDDLDEDEWNKLAEGL